MKSQLSVTFILICIIILALPVVACGQDTITLRASQILPSDHPSHKAFAHMGEILKEKSGGKIVMDIVDNFGGERDLIEAIQLGTLDLIVITTAPLYGFTTDFLIYDLPYIFPDTKTARAVLDGPVGKKSLKNSIHVGLMGLTYYENGMRYITSSSKPIHVPDDLKDLRIRTMESRIHMVTFRTLGATPVPLAYNDLLTNLKSGNIDTQENPITNIYTGEIYKYQKYLTYTEHFYQPAPMFISYAIWSKLTQEQRAIILEAAEESSVYQRKLCDEMVEPATAEFKKYMELIEPDKSIWKKATEPVRAEFLVEVGPDYLEELETEIARLQAAGATE